MRAYVAGPIHSPVYGETKEGLKARFYALASWLAENHPDWEVVNSLEVNPECDGTCQDRSGHPSGEGHSWECWVRYDLRAMLTCDAILLLPGWMHSNGATVEHRVAAMVHMDRFEAFQIGSEWALHPVQS